MLILSGEGEEERECELHQFERNNYFFGKLMTVRDFEVEQVYLNRERSLLNRIIFTGMRVPPVELSKPGTGGGQLVLSKSQMAALREIAITVRAARIRWRAGVFDALGLAGRSARGLGIGALFTGPSGTGKTMAAAVLAGELSMALYRIDLSQVVSRYIGETEKNLRQIFDAAEDGGTILFFDEADALFGERSEVSDAHDRYACREAALLLGMIERYHGLTILSVRDERAVSPGCLSRFRYALRFPER